VSSTLIELAGLNVKAEEFLASVFEAVAQPIWVIDRGGLIRFANAAAITALGYERADELTGRPSHETIHHHHPDGTPFPAAECPVMAALEAGETVASDLDWYFRRDGSIFPVSYVSVPLEMRDGRGAVVAFNDIEARLNAERMLREHDAALAREQASLRRVATLVAGGAASADVLAVIAREVSSVMGLPMVAMWRYEPDDTATVIGEWSERPHRFRAGTRWPLEGRTIVAMVRDTGRPVRIDAVADVPGAIADAGRDAGIRATAGAPIIIDGRVWGVMATAAAGGESLPDRIEERLTEFTELVATAISTTASRWQLARLADEQAALRRVATLVAGESPAAEVFAAVAEELGRLLGVDATALMRCEGDGTATAVASWDVRDVPTLVDTRIVLDGDTVTWHVACTGRPARIDDYAKSSAAHSLGFRSAVGCPVIVAGRLWGVLAAGSRQAFPLPTDTEERIGEFTELVATAISSIQARSELAASRARIAAAADEERRQVVRDLHDGAQQRLVHSIITLKQARAALAGDQQPASALVAEALDHAERANVELRELAHGILPAILTRGGLGVAVTELAERTPVPVEVDVSVGRLPAQVEATAYFFVAEALTNVAKHAKATGARVRAHLDDGTLRIWVRDNGIGGARSDGSGLVGLADRLATLDGRLRVHSPADAGTLLAADIPLPGYPWGRAAA
jgi:PAS domain S-box-containing protein